MLTRAKRTLAHLGLLGLLVISPTIWASDGWVTLGMGRYDGEDYDIPEEADSYDPYKIGGYQAMLAMTYGDALIIRLRGTGMADFTSNDAGEIAAMAGFRLGTSGRAYLVAGVSRLEDVSNEQQSPTVGVPVELLLYPTRALELAATVNFNDDARFYGFTFGVAFGKQRAK